MGGPKLLKFTTLTIYTKQRRRWQLWTIKINRNVNFLILISNFQKMVLVLNGVLQEECPLDTASLFMQHPVYRDTANQLLSIPTKAVSFGYFRLWKLNWHINSNLANFIHPFIVFCRLDPLVFSMFHNVRWHALLHMTRMSTSSALMMLPHALLLLWDIQVSVP